MRYILSCLLCCVLLCPCLRAASVPTWVEVRSPHFVVLTDTNEKQARKLAGQFERMRSLFTTILPNAGSDASLPITVFACKDHRTFDPLLPAAYLQKNSLKLAGLFLTTTDHNYILVRLDTEDEHPFSTVYHEYTHFVLRKAQWLPVWLGEGLAQFYQNTDINEKDVLLGQPSANMIYFLRDHRIIPLDTLFAVGHDSPYYHEDDKGSVFYAESWALTHFIEVSDFEQKTHRLQDYAHLLAKGTEPAQAARQAFGELPALEKSLENYIAHADYKAFRLKTTVVVDESTFKLVPVSPNDVNATRGDMMASSGRMEEARTLLASVLAAEPKNTTALEAMGTIAMREQDRDAAMRYFGDAVAGGSDSLMANYNYAMSLLMGGVHDKDEQVEASLRKAIQLDPTFIPAYDALGHFLADRRKNLDEAHMLCLKAVQAEPDNVHYRVNAAFVSMQQGEDENALRILNSALALTKTPMETFLVQQNQRAVESRIAEKKHAEEIKEKRASGHAEPAGSITTSTSVEPPTPHFAAPAAGAVKRATHGTLHGVACSFPAVLTVSVQGQGKPLTLYIENYYKVPFTTSGFVLKKELDPCKDIEGMKANVSFLPVTDPNVAGRITTVELTK